jgi:hypothetical protein
MPDGTEKDPEDVCNVLPSTGSFKSTVPVLLHAVHSLIRKGVKYHLIPEIN